MGTAKLVVKDFLGARVDLARAIELNPKLPEARAYLGLVLLRSGDTTAAADEFRKELEIDPNDFDANLQLGGLLRQDDDLNGARKLLDRALLIRPDDLAARYQIATIDLSQSRLEPARTSLESIVKTAPDFTEAHVHWLRFTIGSSEKKMGTASGKSSGDSPLPRKHVRKARNVLTLNHENVCSSGPLCSDAVGAEYSASRFLQVGPGGGSRSAREASGNRILIYSSPEAEPVMEGRLVGVGQSAVWQRSVHRMPR